MGDFFQTLPRDALFLLGCIIGAVSGSVMSIWLMNTPRGRR